MKSRNIPFHRANHWVRGLAGIGLAGLAVLSAPFVLADNAPKATAPAKAVQPSTPGSKISPWPTECDRMGQRIIAALVRDDPGAANQFFNFYTAFKCPPQQLAKSFGCLVKLQNANPDLTNPSPEQVAQCWVDPSTTPEIKPPAPDTKGKAEEKK
jgi:hypothetical protein